MSRAVALGLASLWLNWFASGLWIGGWFYAMHEIWRLGLGLTFAALGAVTYVMTIADLEHGR